MTSRSSALLLTTLVLATLTCTFAPVLATSWPGAEPSGAAPPPPDVDRPQRFGWPLPPPHPVVRPFRPPTSPWGPGHRGVDLGAPPGEPVLAAAAGVVTFAGPVAGRGVASINHTDGGGIRTTYEPLTTTVSPGQKVKLGEVIGHLTPGHEGCTNTPACLHWGARRGTTYLDPLTLLSSGRVRLLPWDG